jgi:hypothetical protein
MQRPKGAGCGRFGHDRYSGRSNHSNSTSSSRATSAARFSAESLSRFIWRHFTAARPHAGGRRRNREGAQAVRDVAPVGAPGAGALLALQPDFFFGDEGEGGYGRGELVDLAAGRQVGGLGGGLGGEASGPRNMHVINRRQ